MNADYEQMQHFITDSPWSASAVKQKVGADAGEFLKDVRGETALLIDEYSCRKQGEHSVGVARQYPGCIGKVDNGQVSVVVTLSKSQYTAMVGTRLFLPESWTASRGRMDKAGVPHHRFCASAEANQGADGQSGCSARSTRGVHQAGDCLVDAQRST
jgi:SRSO17 transposase